MRQTIEMIWLAVSLSLLAGLSQCTEDHRPVMPPELRAEGYEYAGLSCPNGYEPRRVWLQEMECILSDPSTSEHRPFSVRSVLSLERKNGQIEPEMEFVSGSIPDDVPLRIISGLEDGLFRDARHLADFGQEPPDSISRILPRSFASRHAVTGFDISGDGEPDWLIFGEYVAPGGGRDYRQLIYSSSEGSFQLVFALPIAPVEDHLAVLDVREWSPEAGCGGVRIEYVSEVTDFNSLDQVHLYDVQFILRCRSRQVSH